MANNNLPAHDFAPAWLKIPSYDSQKPSGAESELLNNASRRDEPRLIRRSDRDEPRYHYSLEQRRERDASGGERKSLFFPSRHQSIDIDDGQYSSSNIFRPVGHLSSSQPSLLRRPNGRPDFRYPNKYNTVELNSNVYSGKTKLGKKSNGTIEGNEIDVGSNNFNQEFPSLKGDGEHSSPCSLNGGAWENPRNAKVHGGIMCNQKIQVIQRPLKTDTGLEGRSKSPINNNSKSVTSISQVNKPSSQCSLYRPLIPVKRQTPPLNPPASQTMEILVKNPKTRSNKSEFLKALRTEAKGSEDEAKKTEQTRSAVEENGKSDVAECERNGDHHVNGLDISKLSVRDNHEDSSLLSSSLEAEQRLLKEMGWKEDGSDDDAYAPLTEDELREFHNLSQKMIAEKRNGIQRALQANWSPKRTLPFANNVVLPPETWSSSSETDSD